MAELLRLRRDYITWQANFASLQSERGCGTGAAVLGGEPIKIENI